MTPFDKLKLRGGRRMSLRGKVLLLALTSVCLINIVSAAFTAALVISKKRDDLTAGAAMLAVIEAQSLASPLWNFNLPAVRDALNALTHNPDFANATVMDADGAVLATVVAPDDFAAGTLSGDSPVVWESEGRRRVLGSVHIQLTTRSLWEFGKQQASTMLTTLLLTCGAVAAAILLAFRLIARPLGRVAVATGMLGRGCHDLVVPEQEREDEIGDIARAVEMSRRQLATIERLRLEQSRYLKTVFANAANGIMEADRDGRIETVNPAAERIFALPAHQLIGMRLGRLMPGLDSQGGEVTEVETYRANGDAATLSVSCGGFEIAGGHKVSVIVHDITERKAAERALDAARRAAEDSSRTKSAFLANMSHEIRTPMNAIIGLTRLVLGSSLTERQRDHLEKVLTSAHGLLGIINDILDLSKIEAGKMTMEATDFSLEDLFEELADINGLRAREKQLELVFDLPPSLPEPLVGDPVRLRQVLVNLIGNAIKFTQQGEVLVSVALEAQTERSVSLRFGVRDTGIGMEPWQLDKVFDAFAQADVSTTRKFGGTGLGLAICHNLVALMGGTIGVDSRIDAGSHFWFTVPFGIRRGAEERAAPEPSRRRDVRVLAVEANPSAREVLGNILDSFQYSHVLAETEAEALAAQDAALGRRQPFHLALVGETLADADGMAAIHRLKRAQGGLRAVLMAAPESAEGLADDGTDDGIDAFLTKPVTPSRLLDTILTALRAHGVAERQGGRRAGDADAVAAPDLRGVRLLLAEDNEINRELAIEVLRHSGAEIDVACTGVEAVLMVQAGGIDAVLMDCQMPLMDGYTATQVIRADYRFRTLPIIAMTANAMAGDREKCLAAGMDDYVTKPFEEADLMRVLRQWVRPNAAMLDAVPADTDAAARAAEAGPPDGLERLTQLDVERGLAHASGNRALYVRLLRRFSRDFGQFHASFVQAMSGGDGEAAIRLAHTVKGLAGAIGAQDLRRSAAALEVALRDGADPQVLNRALPAVVSDIARVVCDIDACLEPKAGTEEEPADQPLPPVSVAALDGLRDRLREADVSAADELGALFTRWPYLRTTLAEVGEYLDQYRFDEALAALDAFADSLSGEAPAP